MFQYLLLFGEVCREGRRLDGRRLDGRRLDGRLDRSFQFVAVSIRATVHVYFSLVPVDASHVFN